jgi:DNA-binding transcriptional LysR family regulator
MEKLLLNDMALFVDVVKLESFTKTAKKYGVSAAAISKRITSLEDKLNISLLNRTTRKIEPTEAGETLYKHASKVYDDAELAYTATLDLHKNPKGLLKISAPINFSHLILAPLLVQFTKKYPGISIDIQLSNDRNIPEIGSYDIAIRAGKLKDANVIAIKLTTVKFVYCATPDYFKHHTPPKKPDDLNKHQLVDYNYREEGALWTFIEKNQHMEQPITPLISSNNGLFVKSSILNHSGIACLPDFMVKKEIEQGKLVACLTKYKTLSQPVWLIHPFANRYFPRKAKVFIDFIKEGVKP